MFLCGGNRYSDSEVRKFNLCDILKLKINFTECTAVIERIAIQHEEVNLSSGTMSLKEDKERDFVIKNIYDF